MLQYFKEEQIITVEEGFLSVGWKAQNPTFTEVIPSSFEHCVIEKFQNKYLETYPDASKISSAGLISFFPTNILFFSNMMVVNKYFWWLYTRKDVCLHLRKDHIMLFIS